MGSPVGSDDGSAVGSDVGSAVGSPEGSPVGSPVGSAVGSPVGVSEGSCRTGPAMSLALVATVTLGLYVGRRVSVSTCSEEAVCTLDRYAGGALGPATGLETSLTVGEYVGASTEASTNNEVKYAPINIVCDRGCDSSTYLCYELEAEKHC